MKTKLGFYQHFDPDYIDRTEELHRKAAIVAFSTIDWPEPRSGALTARRFGLKDGGVDGTRTRDPRRDRPVF